MLKGYQEKILSQDIYIIEKDNQIYAITTKNIYDYVNENTPLIKEAFKQIHEYVAGKRQMFDLPLLLEGTPFQIKVWQALLKIPYGKTCSYQQIAKTVGSPKAYRAVGMANNRNRIMIVIPCHRVIGADGKLVGYAGGIEMKKALLEIEAQYAVTNLKSE